VAIDQRRIGQGPEMFRRLKLGGIGWQKQQVDMVRNLEGCTGMPARLI
jgi:hypothetical protein